MAVMAAAGVALVWRHNVPAARPVAEVASLVVVVVRSPGALVIDPLSSLVLHILKR